MKSSMVWHPSNGDLFKDNLFDSDLSSVLIYHHSHLTNLNMYEDLHKFCQFLSLPLSRSEVMII